MLQGASRVQIPPSPLERGGTRGSPTNPPSSQRLSYAVQSRRRRLKGGAPCLLKRTRRSYDASTKRSTRATSTRWTSSSPRTTSTTIRRRSLDSQRAGGSQAGVQAVLGRHARLSPDRGSACGWGQGRHPADGLRDPRARPSRRSQDGQQAGDDSDRDSSHRRRPTRRALVEHRRARIAPATRGDSHAGSRWGRVEPGLHAAARRYSVQPRARRGGRAVECGGLENRYPSLGGSRVQIPPPPLFEMDRCEPAAEAGLARP